MGDFVYHGNDYDRSKLKPGLVHLGWGNFARSFIAEIANDIAQKGHTDFGLVAVAPSGRQTHDITALNEQQNVYHLMRRNGHEVCQRIDALCDAVIGAQDNKRVIAIMSRPETQIVTMTVTKDGYSMNGDSIDREKLANDIAAIREKKWDEVKTVPGWIAAGLYQRYDEGKAPFVVMSCDNIPLNGKMTATLLHGIADAVGDAGFSKFMRDVPTPNTAVDRITPKQHFEGQSEYLKAQTGRDDRAPVVSEDHRELVVERTKGLPAKVVEAFQSAGVNFVDDINPYQDRKIRILNAGHMLFGMAGAIMQVETVRDAMKQPELRAFLNKFHDQTVDALTVSQPEDVQAFRRQTIARFENPHLTDETSRLVANTTSKVHARLLNIPGLMQGKDTDASAFAVATWVRYLQGRDDSGNHYNPDAADKNTIEKYGLDSENPKFKTNLKGFLMRVELNLSGNKAESFAQSMDSFVDKVADDLKLIEGKGLRNAIRDRFPVRDTQPALRVVNSKNEPK